MITLFPASATTFETNGLGNLSDAISSIVTEVENSEYELEIEYPITGIHYSDITLRRIILAKPNPHTRPQPFRIYSISKPINGVITINAQHISYDMSGLPVSPFSSVSAKDALIKLKQSSVLPCIFTFETDIDKNAQLDIVTPGSIRGVLGYNICWTYGGEYEFDMFSVKLHKQRGQNRGVSIRYGKNLTDLRQDENCASVYTGVYPFWYSENEGLRQLPEKIINAPGTYDFVRIYPLDLSSIWSEVPTDEQLTIEANKYMTEHKIGIPNISIDVSFVQLSQTEEYKNFTTLEDVKLCDYVSVEFPKLGVSATAKCIKTLYDCIRDKYISLELGEAKSNIATTISDGFRNTNQKIEATSKMFSKEVDTIKIGLADIDDAMIKKANVVDLQATNAVIQTLELDMGVISEILAGNIVADNIDVEFLKVLQGWMLEGSIGDAQIKDLNANKIKAGNIDTSLVRIVSKDGAVVITGNQIMINDVTDPANPINRITIGKIAKSDGSIDYSMLIRAADGQTIMFDSKTGITNAGITSGAIKDNVVADDASIKGFKLDINSVIREVNDKGTVTISGTKIQVGDKKLDVILSEQNNTITEQGETLSSHEGKITANSEAIGLKVDSSTYSSDMTNLTKTLSDQSGRIAVTEEGIKAAATKVEMTKAISDVTIGSNNYIRNSAFKKDLLHWTTSGGIIDVIGVNDTKSVKIVGEFGKAKYLEQDIKGDSILSKINNVMVSCIIKGDSIVKGSINPFICLYVEVYYTDGTINYLGKDSVPLGTTDWIRYIVNVPIVTDKVINDIRVFGYARDFTGSVWFDNFQLEIGNKVTDFKESQFDIQESLDTSNISISGLVDITKSQSASINLLSDNYKTTVSTLETTRTDLETLTQNVSTQFIETNNSFTFDFETVTSRINNLDEYSTKEIETIKNYIQFINGNIILGQSGNDFTLMITNEKISFMQGGKEVAYLSNSKLYITQGEILNSLKLGRYSFKPRDNGNLSFRWE